MHILSCVPSNVAYLESPKKKNASNNLPDLVSINDNNYMCVAYGRHGPVLTIGIM